MLCVDRKTLDADVRAGLIKSRTVAGIKQYLEADVVYVASFTVLQSAARRMLGMSKRHFLAWTEETDMLPSLETGYRRVYYRRNDVVAVRNLLADYMTPPQAASKFDIDARQLYAAARRGLVESFIIGSTMYVLRQDIEELYPSGKQYSIGEAAEFLGMSPNKVKRLCQEYQLRSTLTAGGHYRINEQDLRRFTQQYTLGDLMRILGISRYQARALCSTGKIHTTTTSGGHYRISEVALRQYQKIQAR